MSTTKVILPVIVEGKGILQTLGVKFLGSIKDNRNYQDVELPEGWKIVSCSHPRLSFLVDNSGNEIAFIFDNGSTKYPNVYVTVLDIDK